MCQVTSNLYTIYTIKAPLSLLICGVCKSTFKDIVIIYILLYVALGGDFGRHQNASFCYQKVANRSRSVSVHSDFSYDALRAHRRGRGDNSKN